jgi:hypothetical protein
MTKCSDAELLALRESGTLLRFAAEHVSGLDDEFSLAIAEARAAAGNEAWTPEIAQRFWHAFGKLCDLIKPTTMDALEATRPVHNPGLTGWLLGQRAKKSLAERSSRRYIVSLSMIIIVIVFLQLYIWACITLSKTIDDLLTSTKTQFVSTSGLFLSLNVATSPQDHIWTAEEGRIGNQISSESFDLSSDLDKILYQAHLLAALTFQKDPTVKMSEATPPDSTDPGLWYKEFRFVEGRLSAAQALSSNVQQVANLIVGTVGSYVLPVFFGTVGAIAFVVRTISDQIRSTTFSQTSPIHHFMRVTLGALMGAVIGLFSGSTSRLTLPPLALAFLAGYGVEGVFAMFDELIQRIGGQDRAKQ